MNEPILKVMKSYPLGGGYTWDASKPTSGCTIDIVYKNKLILPKDTSTYCVGLTFETWFRAIGSSVDLPVSEMQKVQRFWYCAAGNRGGCQDALTAVRLGITVSLDQAKPGDFLQLWRHSGSGHSVIFLSHDKAADTITYWSTQPKTEGIGERTEKMEYMKDLYFVRALNQEVNFDER